MSKNIADLKTLAIVLRRTNYGEADRILNLITPDGKKTAMARGVRKAKSKLAGGVEMFALNEVNLHFGRGEIATVIGAKGVRFYKNILVDYSRMELAALVLKRISVAAEAVETSEFFEIARACLEGIDNGMKLALVESWFLLNLMKASGEEVNLYRDGGGDKLEEGVNYYYNVSESAFVESPQGEFETNDLKLLRLMVTTPLEVVGRVKNADEKLSKILRFARTVSKII